MRSCRASDPLYRRVPLAEIARAGTRVPFISYWPGVIEPGTSDALISQLDLFSSLAALVGSEATTPDSQNQLPVLLGQSDTGREELVLEATTRTAFRQGDWVMIPPYRGRPRNEQVDIETGTAPNYQLYNLATDIGQQQNLAEAEPERLRAMVRDFEAIRGTDYGNISELELQ